MSLLSGTIDERSPDPASPYAPIGNDVSAESTDFPDFPESPDRFAESDVTPPTFAMFFDVVSAAAPNDERNPPA